MEAPTALTPTVSTGIVHTGGQEAGLSAAPPPPLRRPTLTPADSLGLFGGTDSPFIRDQAESLATALAGLDRNGVRLRLVGKLASVERQNLAFAQRMLSEALRRRDRAGVDLAEKVVRGIHARLLSLLREHRQSCEREQRPAVYVAVGQADRVTVQGGR